MAGEVLHKRQSANKAGVFWRTTAAKLAGSSDAKTGLAAGMTGLGN
jgi:hypothetical protein